MRSTKASSAVERLRARSGNPGYTMVMRADGLFALRLMSAEGAPQMLGTPLPMDEFVAFVNGLEARAPKPASKLDTAFRAQLGVGKEKPDR